jgi:hypothetical protein
MLFRKKSRAQVADQQPVLVWSKEFPQSGTFKGYRLVKLSTYNDEQVKATLKHFSRSEFNFKGCQIRLDNLLLPGVFVDGESCVVNVYVDDKKVGYIYNTSTCYEMLTKYEYDKVYLKVEGPNVFLFVHYTGASPCQSQL